MIASGKVKNGLRKLLQAFYRRRFGEQIQREASGAALTFYHDQRRHIIWAPMSVHGHLYQIETRGLRSHAGFERAHLCDRLRGYPHRVPLFYARSRKSSGCIFVYHGQDTIVAIDRRASKVWKLSFSSKKIENESIALSEVVAAVEFKVCPTLLDAGKIGRDVFFLCMEYIRGKNVRAVSTAEVINKIFLMYEEIGFVKINYFNYATLLSKRLGLLDNTRYLRSILEIAYNNFNGIDNKLDILIGQIHGDIKDQNIISDHECFLLVDWEHSRRGNIFIDLLRQLQLKRRSDKPFWKRVLDGAVSAEEIDPEWGPPFTRAIENRMGGSLSSSYLSSNLLWAIVEDVLFYAERSESRSLEDAEIPRGCREIIDVVKELMGKSSRMKN